MRCLYRGIGLLVVGLLIVGCVAPVFGQPVYEYDRNGAVAYIRAVQLPPLIARLVSTPEPTELSPPEFAQLKAYLVATSRPRRMEKDQFYRHISPTRDAKEVKTLTKLVEGVRVD